MKNILSSALLVVAGLVSVQAYDNASWRQKRERKGGVADLLDALEGGRKVKTVTITRAAAAVATPKPAVESLTISAPAKTITEQAAAVTMTETVMMTITMLGNTTQQTVTLMGSASIITESTTVTITQNNAVANVTAGIIAATGASIAGVAPQAVASGTTPAIVKSEAAAPTSPAAAAVGVTGSMASGTGTTNADGSCACACLCASGSFNSVGAAGAIAGTTMLTMASPSVAAINPTLTSAAIVKVSAAAQSVSAASNAALVVPTPAVQAAAAQVNGINISTFSLSSNIQLGSLAKRTAVPEA